MTIIVKIGNSDDKLTQKEWHKFFVEVDKIVASNADNIWFRGVFNGAEEWQNACWVFEPFINAVEEILEDLGFAKMKFRQDSIAIIVGDTKFI